jgi:hypothetical protein
MPFSVRTWIEEPEAVSAGIQRSPDLMDNSSLPSPSVTFRRLLSRESAAAKSAVAEPRQVQITARASTLIALGLVSGEMMDRTALLRKSLVMAAILIGPPERSGGFP